MNKEYIRPPVEKIYKRIGLKIKAARLALDTTQEELAKKTKTSRPHLTKMEAGTQRIWPHQLIGIARVLKVSPESFMEGIWK